MCHLVFCHISLDLRECHSLCIYIAIILLSFSLNRNILDAVLVVVSLLKIFVKDNLSIFWLFLWLQWALRLLRCVVHIQCRYLYSFCSQRHHSSGSIFVSLCEQIHSNDMKHLLMCVCVPDDQADPSTDGTDPWAVLFSFVAVSSFSTVLLGFR